MKQREQTNGKTSTKLKNPQDKKKILQEGEFSQKKPRTQSSVVTGAGTGTAAASPAPGAEDSGFCPWELRSRSMT